MPRLSDMLNSRAAMHQLQRLFTARTWRKLRLRARLRWFARDAMRSPLKYVRLAFLGLILFYTVFGNYGILARLRLEIHKSHLSAELTRETQRSNELRSAIQKMQTLEEIERWAREKYNLSLPSEIVYVIK